MNETIMTALGHAVTTLTTALKVAQAGRIDETRELLIAAESHLEEGQGGNAAHAARRRKALRLEAEVRALLPEPEDTALVVAASPTKALRGVAPPQTLEADAWARVGEALRAGGADAEALDLAAGQHEQVQAEALIARERQRARVAERLALQARVEAAALTGDIDAANCAWDRLFDVVTALRGTEGKARRSGQPDEQAARDYHAAREDTLKIRRWGRGAQAA
ncbi:hypothetical protein DESA109040_05745 [Deinococcus saxicola]|uniref:hypothetical protein n=1 Tax=Deinococcus saxicola TaxID=249406 RepID=UPI0039F0C5A6